MKKNYFMLAAATMMLAACAETDLVNEIAVEETPQAIGFETFANKTTRQVSNATALESYHDAFGVWAYKTTKDDGPVMGNYKVEHTATTTEGRDPASGEPTYTTTYSWEYKNVRGQSLKYWDKNAEYSFYAYAPYSTTVTIDANKNIIIPWGGICSK